MERLTQTSELGGVAFTFDLDITCKPEEAQKILRLAEKLKQYEDAEEQGLLVRLPCKVGDTVYVFEYPNKNRFCGVQITKIEIYENSIWLSFTDGLWDKKIDEIGKTVFLTKEEAEAKLKEMECCKPSFTIGGCVDCDECLHRDVDSVCDISDNEEECPLL